MIALKTGFMLLSYVVGVTSLIAEAGETRDGQFAVNSNLRAGVAKVDITPEETDGVIVTGHRRKVFGVRDPLRAGVLVLDNGETRAAIVTLDTIGAWDEMVKLARRRIEKEARVPASQRHQTSGSSRTENSHAGFDNSESIILTTHEVLP